MDHYPVTPSEPYSWETHNQSKIVLLPSNETDFVIDYSNLSKLNPSITDIDFEGNDTNWRRTRFIVLTVHGTFDDDEDKKGATIKEFALFE